MFDFFKPKNARRKDKRETLNVKMRAGEVRARRVRFVGALLCFSLTLFLLVMLGWKGIETVMHKAVYTNPSLAIDRIEVETDGVLSHEKIREWARVKNGDNLLKLDLTRVKRDLELRPIIESASAEKILPRTLRLSVVERKPLAVIYLYSSANAQLPAGFDRVYLDASGIVIPPLPREQRNPKADPNPSALPVLIGLSARELRPGIQVDSPQIRSALDLIALYDRSPVATMSDFKTVDLSSPQTLVVRTDQNIEITFGLENFPRQLARLQTTLEYARRNHRILASLDLAVGNYVPARWFEPSTNSPAVPVAPITLKPKKKHV